MLKNLKILDFSLNLPGPLCSLYLADMGADVLKVEPPVTGDPIRGNEGEEVNALVAYVHRNKKSLELNLKLQESRDIIIELIKDYDILLEGFRPGVMKRLGLDYDTLKTIQPRLIYCSITGYGQESPLANRAGHDLNFLARSGVASMILDEQKKPVLTYLQLADTMSAHHAMIGIMAAYIQRESTGIGQHIDISITDSTFSLLHLQGALHFSDVSKEGIESGMFSGLLPQYNIYRCSDNRFITVGALESNFSAKFSQALKVPLSKKEIAELFATKTRDEWVKALENEDFCVEPVIDFTELKNDSYISSRDLILNVNGHLQLSLPMKFSRYQPNYNVPAPRLGQHTKLILESLKKD